MEALEKILGKLPLMPIILVICAFVAYNHYDWMESQGSDLGQRKNFLKNTQGSLDASKKKLTEAQEFFKNLDVQRLRIRQLTTQLDNTKATLSADLDVANFIKMVTLEAKKLRLTVKSIKPAEQRRREYYVEVPFTVELKGAYVQMMLFFDRISKLQHVVRVGDFNMKPTDSVYTKYVELDGTAQLITYRYLGTHADEILNKPEMREVPADATPAPAKKDQGGAS